MGLKVLIVDGHRLFADAVRAALVAVGIKVVDVVGRGRDALEAVRVHQPGMVLVDLDVPDEGGVRLGHRILEECPGAKIVLMTEVEDLLSAQDALRAGVHGVLTKESSVSELVEAMRTVAAGHVVVTARRQRALSTSKQRSGEPELRLTERELQVLELMAEGASGEEIATRLAISPNTVRGHIQNILSKLQVHSRLAAVSYAIRHGLTDRPVSA